VISIPGRFITGRFTTGRFNTVGSSCGRFITRSIQHRSIHHTARKTSSPRSRWRRSRRIWGISYCYATTPGHRRVAYLLRAHIHTWWRGRWHRPDYRSARFPPSSWNKRESATEEIARTTNHIWEGWHNSHQSLLLCNHPSIGHFLMELWNRLQCKLPVSFRQLLEVNKHRRKSTVNPKNVSNVYFTIWTSRWSDILACYGSHVVVLNDKNSFW